eukprot:8332810-Pyramimonas_sp.AAC.1
MRRGSIGCSTEKAPEGVRPPAAFRPPRVKSTALTRFVAPWGALPEAPQWVRPRAPPRPCRHTPH